jgi:hypothetical protein
MAMMLALTLFAQVRNLSLNGYDRRQPFVLELPDISVAPITEPEAVIPTANLTRLRFRIKNPFAKEINYGKIYTTINGEAAGTIQNINSDSNGYLVTCELASKPRFRLQPGKNVVEIYAIAQDRRDYYASYVLITGTSSAVAQAGNAARDDIPVNKRAAISSQFKGRKFALIVGISRYKFHDGGLKDLAYADADARAVREFLERPAGGNFAAADIHYLENEKATVGAMRAALQQFLSKAGAGDLVFLYLAGHGTPDPYAPQTLYFILHDTKVADMPGTALPMKELQETLDYNLRAERVVVFIDACHSAGLSGEQLVETRGLENNVINLYAAKLFNEKGRAVMTSSDVNELSRESQKWGGGHGIFTWALLEGLRGKADANSDRLVTTGELFSFVRERVRAETEFRQNPRVLPGANNDLPLAVAGK